MAPPDPDPSPLQPAAEPEGQPAQIDISAATRIRLKASARLGNRRNLSDGSHCAGRRIEPDNDPQQRLNHHVARTRVLPISLVQTATASPSQGVPEGRPKATVTHWRQQRRYDRAASHTSGRATSP